MEEARERKLTTADGRAIGFAEFGPADGLPFLYCHGFPGSRLEAALAAGACHRLGIRLIALDRPGIGTSSPRADRGIADWPQDALTVADHLDIHCLPVLGISGGAPYALACSALAPKRFPAIGLVAPLGPPPCRLQIHQRLVIGLAAGPFPGPTLCRLLLRFFSAQPAFLLALMALRAPAADRAVLERSEIRTVFQRSFAEASRQGLNGLQQELQLYASSWGYAPGDVGVPVLLWHGIKDKIVPVTHGQWLASALPQCRASFPAGDGHISLPVDRCREILAALLTEARLSAAAGPGCR